MNITNEKLYEMIVEIKSDMSDFKAEIRSEIAEIKAAQSELRADISKCCVIHWQHRRNDLNHRCVFGKRRVGGRTVEPPLVA